jgi:hypothetical protein
MFRGNEVEKHAAPAGEKEVKWMSTMSEKHTPGPWEWVKHEFTGHYDLVHIVPGEKTEDGDPVFVKILDDGSGCGEYAPEITPDSPNGRLVTTAPDLLAACKAALDFAHAVEAWEARVIMEDICWNRTLEPALTQELYDEMIELQTKRNALIEQLKMTIAKAEKAS